MATQGEYSLPGIMHYLQKETTKNENDRIQWEAERAELKANIAKLEGDNKSLNNQVKNLQSELNSVKNTGKSSFNPPKSAFNEIDINPLVQARKKLQSQVSEISVLLNSTPIDFSKLELNGAKSFYSSNPGLQLDETTAEFSLNSNDPSDRKRSIETSHPQYPGLSKSTSDLEISKKFSVTTTDQFTPVTHDIESDAETITDDFEQEQHTKSPQQQTNIHHEGMEKFILKSFSTVTSLAYNDKEILCASEDGVIKLWEIQDIFNSKVEIDPKETYHGDGTPIKFMKWVNQEWFVTASDTNLRFWNKSLKTSSCRKISYSSIESFDVSEDCLAFTSQGKLSVYRLKSITDKVSYEHLKDISPDCDFVALKSTDLVLVKNDCVQMLDYKAGLKNLKEILVRGVDFDKSISKFSIEAEYWCFIVGGIEVILYDPIKKEVKFKQKYNTQTADVRVNESHIVVFLTDGEVKVYETKNTAQMFKDYNIYKLFFTAPNGIKHEDEAILKDSLKTGQLFYTNYVVAACEDSQVRGFKIQ